VAAAALECEVQDSPDPVRVSCRSASSALSRKVIVALLKRPPAGESRGLFCYVTARSAASVRDRLIFGIFWCGLSKNITILLSSKSGSLVIVANKGALFFNISACVKLL
jgi:hypothetical protein